MPATIPTSDEISDLLHPKKWKASRAIGLTALFAGGAAIAAWVLVAILLFGPFMFWLAWNELGLATSMGLPELGFWAIVLATVFLAVGWFGKVAIAGLVFVFSPDWLDGTASVSWPEPTFSTFLAVAILAAIAATPHARHHKDS